MLNESVLDSATFLGPKDSDELGRREYVVTLHNFEDLDNFYDDMETIGGNLYIPNREVSVELRRPISRSTHYRLTPEEAEQISKDPRVLAVELTMEEIGVAIVPTWTINSSNWDKSGTTTANMYNWGLLRCYNGVQTSNWGSDGTSSISGQVTFTASGKNVDFVACEFGNLDPNHPEFAVNPDGTGGSRVIQYNWLKDTPNVTGQSAGTYDYSSGTYDSHQTYCATIGTGNTQGWAKDANIYSIGKNIDLGVIFDYIRYWHQTKPINPVTGRRNPTVVSNSWAILLVLTIGYPYANTGGNTYISSIQVGGVTANTTSWSLTDFDDPSTKTGGAMTFTSLSNLFGSYNSGNPKLYMPWASQANLQSVSDCANAGVIIVGAAGNEGTITAAQSTNNSDYYNDYCILTNSGNGGTSTFWPHRGSFFCSPKAINVGAINSSVIESKATYSNTGTKVDIWAPGDNIMGGDLGVGVPADPRNSSYRFGKASGTSCSCPQVAGFIGCLLETYPTLDVDGVLSYINSTATKNQMGNYVPAGQIKNTQQYMLMGSANNFLYYTKERKDQGDLYPKQNVYIKPAGGQIFPRPRIKQV
jgi:hypothetical protein